jgi:uncharacterized protein (UPF0147 family)
LFIDVEMQYPYDRCIQSADHVEDETNIEPIEEEQSVPKNIRQSNTDNGQRIDDYDRQNTKRNTEIIIYLLKNIIPPSLFPRSRQE